MAGSMWNDRKVPRGDRTQLTLAVRQIRYQQLRMLSMV